MYYQPKPICSQRSVIAAASSAQAYLRKIGRIIITLILVLATAELFALMDRPAAQHSILQTNLNSAPAAQMADSYLQ